MVKGLKIALIVVLILAAVGGGTAGIISLVDSDKFDTKNISDLSFGVGGLDSAGKYMSTDKSIYTKDAFECQGLSVSLEFDSEISYQIYFYDQNNDFVHTTGKLESAFVSDSVPFFAKYARIVITPDDDEKVTTLEVLKYAKQLNAKVNREQGFKNYTENLMEVDIEGSLLQGDNKVVPSDIDGAFISKYVNISSYDEGLMFRFHTTDISGSAIFLYDFSKNYLGNVVVKDVSVSVFTSSEGINYYEVSLEKLREKYEDIVFVRFSMSVPFEFYCR